MGLRDCWNKFQVNRLEKKLEKATMDIAKILDPKYEAKKMILQTRRDLIQEKLDNRKSQCSGTKMIVQSNENDK